MGFKDTILQFLPRILKDVIDAQHIAEATGQEFDVAKEFLRLLIYRGLANRYLDEANVYYSSLERPVDVGRIAQGRFLRKRYNEPAEDFETRVAAFPAAVLFWGTRKGIRDEVERTGLVADEGFSEYGIKELASEDQRWIILSCEDQAGVAEVELSHVFMDGSPYSEGTISVNFGETAVTGVGTHFVDNVQAQYILVSGTAKQMVETVVDNTHLTLEAGWPGSSLIGASYEARPDDLTVRDCRIYKVNEEYFIFLLKLTNPEVVEFSEEEIKDIVRNLKPAPCQGWIYFPGEAYAKEV